MLLLNLILLVDVTFSTPTGDYTQNPIFSQMALINSRDVKAALQR
jgi:hypothetical protein